MIWNTNKHCYFICSSQPSFSVSMTVFTYSCWDARWHTLQLKSDTCSGTLLALIRITSLWKIRTRSCGLNNSVSQFLESLLSPSLENKTKQNKTKTTTQMHKVKREEFLYHLAQKAITVLAPNIRKQLLKACCLSPSSSLVYPGKHRCEYAAELPFFT